MVDQAVITTAIIGFLSTIVSGWTSYIFTRKKYNSEVDLNLIDKMQKSLDFYMKLSEDNKRILDETLTKLEVAEKKNAENEKEIRQLRNHVFTLMTQICTDLSCEARKPHKKPHKAKKAEHND